MNKEKKEVARLLKIAQGNLEASIKMIEDDRYCVDISNQIMAVNALLKKANNLLIKQHMSHCVFEAFNSDDEDLKHNKMNEVIDLLKKVSA
ncbi:MAG: metal-sensing transcriptional repressor [Erysipelothrix sp.]|nr:metal-sensing transcriptional repressor [Erysipelothrix sp.]